MGVGVGLAIAALVSITAMCLYMRRKISLIRKQYHKSNNKARNLTAHQPNYEQLNLSNISTSIYDIINPKTHKTDVYETVDVNRDRHHVYDKL